MPLSRREMITLIGAGAAAQIALPASSALASRHGTIKAVAFDAFPILDPRPVFGLAKEMYKEKGGAFVVTFRTRLFEYQWLRALAGQYKDFYSIIDDAHLFAAHKLNLELTQEKRDTFRQAFLNLKAWPDVPVSLQKLKDKGVKLAFLSNMTPEMLNAGIVNSGLEGMFDHVLSTDAIKTYKPDPRAYQMGVDAFALPKEQIAFAAFAGWDVAGASWFGYPTVWINRLGFKSEILDASPALTGSSLEDLVKFVLART